MKIFGLKIESPLYIALTDFTPLEFYWDESIIHQAMRAEIVKLDQ